MEKAYFAAGCFWHVEAAFRRVPGVTDARVGYSGGHTPNPNYEKVCAGNTGHAEVVEVTFDPNTVSYEHLVGLFFGIHDPTTLNRQGPDVGEQYRSAIFYTSPEQEKIAEKFKMALAASGKLKRPVVTQISPATEFYPAEEYHQRYFEKHGQVCGF